MTAARAIGTKNYAAAIEACKRMLSENKADYFAISMIAFCYEWNGDIANAIIYADKFLARFPNGLDMLLLSARYWATNGDDERSYHFVCRAIENRSETQIFFTSRSQMPKMRVYSSARSSLPRHFLQTHAPDRLDKSI